jgi:hypothetical protein
MTGRLVDQCSEPTGLLHGSHVFRKQMYRQPMSKEVEMAWSGMFEKWI